MFSENGKAGHRRFGIQEPDLETAYEAAHEEARNLLARIEELLCDLPAPGSEDYPIDWATVGSVKEVNRLLEQITEFLGSGIDNLWPAEEHPPMNDTRKTDWVTISVPRASKTKTSKRLGLPSTAKRGRAFGFPAARKLGGLYSIRIISESEFARARSPRSEFFLIGRQVVGRRRYRGML